MKAAVLTISDRCSRGEQQDLSGPALVALLERHGWTVTARATVPDEIPEIRAALEALRADAAMIVTTGGTGLSPRDVTPEAVRPLLDKEIPGLAEKMRRDGLAKTPHATLSRSLAGVRQDALVLCLPGSQKGAVDSLHSVLEVLPHAVEIIGGAQHD